MTTFDRIAHAITEDVAEEWRACVGHPGYEVSDQGRVRSLDRKIWVDQPDRWSTKMLRVCRSLRGRVLRAGRTAAGRLTVAIAPGGGSVLVHVLVLEAFVGPRPDGHLGLHWDDDSSNNTLPNLRWGTVGENAVDAYRNGKRPRGHKHHEARLTESDIPVIRALIGKVPCVEIGQRYGVSKSAILAIKWRETWTHVPDDDAAEACRTVADIVADVVALADRLVGAKAVAA